MGCHAFWNYFYGPKSSARFMVWTWVAVFLFIIGVLLIVFGSICLCDVQEICSTNDDEGGPMMVAFGIFCLLLTLTLCYGVGIYCNLNIPGALPNQSAPPKIHEHHVSDVESSGESNYNSEESQRDSKSRKGSNSPLSGKSNKTNQIVPHSKPEALTTDQLQTNAEGDD